MLQGQQSDNCLLLYPIKNDHKEKEEVNQKKVPHKFIEDINLYDLNDVDDLYDRYLLKWSKQNHTMKTEDMAHYYRFVKTVVEVNEKRFAGEDVTLGPDADEIKEPNEFFYG
ncbi:hypothetical protein HF086_004029 [Spodoptera exigua]|uniref:Uncharacterized protein n=1 Tax=Spodoptera exigua TaxID=7107 RepID=A0A922MBJ4_SPOEX|nr:hypothetical protein HF086_004029 [Spodoptera exigua]